MGNQLAIEDSPGPWECAQPDSGQKKKGRSYPRRYKDFLHVWECSTDVNDPDVTHCLPVYIPTFSSFQSTNCYIVVHVQHKRVPKRSHNKEELQKASANINWEEIVQSFGSLRRTSLKRPLINKEDCFVSTSSPHYEIHVWNGRKSSAAVQSVTVTEARKLDSMMKANKSAAGSLRTCTTSEFIPLPFDTESVGHLLEPLKKQNIAVITSILSPNVEASKEKPKIPRLVETNSPDLSATDKKKVFASFKSARNVGIKSLSALAVPSLQIPGQEIRNFDTEKKLKEDKLERYGKICSEIEQQLFLAGEAVASNRQVLMNCQITDILNCAASYCESYFQDDFTYTNLHLYDGKYEDISCFFLYVIEIVEEVRAKAGGKLLFHCQQGVSRSAAFLIMYLMWKQRESFDTVYKRVKSIRGIVNPNTGFVVQLLLWGKRLGLQDPPPYPWVMLVSPHSTSDPQTYVARNVDPKYSSFDCRGVFIIQDVDIVYKWIGSRASAELIPAADEYITRIQKFMGASENVITIQQGNEPEEFCALLGGTPAAAEEREKFTEYLALI